VLVENGEQPKTTLMRNKKHVLEFILYGQIQEIFYLHKKNEFRFLKTVVCAMCLMPKYSKNSLKNIVRFEWEGLLLPALKNK
jgi:hypothetical protein